MSQFTINGTEIPITTESRKLPPRRAVFTTTTFNNGLRQVEYGSPKDEWSIVTSEMLTADADDLEADLLAGSVTAAGDWTGGTYICLAFLGETSTPPGDASMRVVRFTLRTV